MVAAWFIGERRGTVKIVVEDLYLCLLLFYQAARGGIKASVTFASVVVVVVVVVAVVAATRTFRFHSSVAMAVRRAGSLRLLLWSQRHVVNSCGSGLSQQLVQCPRAQQIGRSAVANIFETHHIF